MLFYGSFIYFWVLYFIACISLESTLVFSAFSNHDSCTLHMCGFSIRFIVCIIFSNFTRCLSPAVSHSCFFSPLAAHEKSKTRWGYRYNNSQRAIAHSPPQSKALLVCWSVRPSQRHSRQELFHVERTKYLDHLLFQWNRQRGESKWKLWPLQFNWFHLYSKET